MSTRAHWVAAVVALLLLPVGCSNSGGGKTSGTDTVTFDDVTFAGSVTWYGQVPVMVANDKGFFKDEGIKLNYQPIVASADRISAVLTGHAEFSNLGQTAPLTAMAQGAKGFKFVANIDSAPGNEGVYARKGINSLEDLRGKKVAGNTSAKISLISTLESKGMSLSEINYVDLDPPSMALALRRGDVDAVSVWKPILDQVAEAVPGGKFISTDRDTAFFKSYGIPPSADILIMNAKLIKDNPDLAKRIMAAVFRGVNYANDHPEDTAKTVAHYFGKTPEQVLPGIKGFKFHGAADYDKHMASFAKEVQAFAEFMNGHKLLASVPKTIDWADSSMGQVDVKP